MVCMGNAGKGRRVPVLSLQAGATRPGGGGTSGGGPHVKPREAQLLSARRARWQWSPRFFLASPQCRECHGHTLVSDLAPGSGSRPRWTPVSTPAWEKPVMAVWLESDRESAYSQRCQIHPSAKGSVGQSCRSTAWAQLQVPTTLWAVEVLKESPAPVPKEQRLGSAGETSVLLRWADAEVAVRAEFL